MASSGCNREKKVVAALDIGSTTSGYAFSFKDKYEDNPMEIFCNEAWGKTSGLVTMKTLTCALFDGNQRFHSFGYQAEDVYSELLYTGTSENWYFFKNFKMKVSGANIQSDVEIEDDKGRKMSAKVVFGEVFKYLKNHLLNELVRHRSGLVNKDIEWVLTVPATWTDTATELMREAAYCADIQCEQLSIILDSEAALLCCQFQSTYQSLKSGNADIARPGSKFMVLDLGGETAVFTIYKRQSDAGLKELHKPTSGTWGSSGVDTEFKSLLISIVGNPTFIEFSQQYKEDMVDLQRSLEKQKRLTKPKSKSENNVIKIPVAIAEIYEKKEKKTIEETINKMPLKDKINWKRNEMVIDAKLFQWLFQACCDEIISHMRKLLDIPGVKGTNICLMVGGFSESQIIQDALKTAFPKVSFVIPDEAGVAVVKGAVLFGHCLDAIASRVVD